MLSDHNKRWFFQLPVIKELGEDAFFFVFEGSELLAKVTEGLDPETCKVFNFFKSKCECFLW